MNHEICNECGKSVKFGSGLFVNRILDLNDYNDKLAMGKLFPNGNYICAICDEQFNLKSNAGNHRIPN